MSRFSIRIQCYVLAGAFLCALLLLAVFAWTANKNTAQEFFRFEDGAEQIESLNAIKEDVEQATGDILSFAAGRDETLDDFLGNMDEVLEEIAKAPDLFVQTSSDSTRDAATAASLEELRAIAEDLQAQAAAMREVALFDRKVRIDREILPVVDALRDGVNGLQDKANARLANLTRDAVAKIDRTADVLLYATIAAGIFALVVATAAGHILATPIAALATSVEGLARKDFRSEVPGTTRGDEVGRIAVRLEDLRDQLAAADASEARARAENGLRVDLFQTMGLAMSKLKSGELSHRIAAGDWLDLGEGYVKLCHDFNSLAESLEGLVSSLRDSAGTVEHSAGELSDMATDMSRRAEVQAATLEESAAALDELSESVQSAAERAKAADEAVTDGRRRAEEGREIMERATAAMASIAKSSDQITQIIDVIDDIAFQTNLLALNAGVEAARAGESGKGFAVVASEVRGLAQRAAESANEIKDLVFGSTRQVEDGEDLVKQTGERLAAIVESVTGVSEMVSAIAASAREQAAGVKEINVGVAELDKVTQQNAAMVTQASASSKHLNGEATRLSALLSAFTGGEAVAKAPAPAAEATYETLLHGTWEGEEPTPEPISLEVEPAPPAPKPKQAVGQDMAVWDEF